MDLKFTFGASNPLPLAQGAGSASAAPSASNELELRVSLSAEVTGMLICEGLSGDGVSYARAEKTVKDPGSPAALAAGVRSALARAGAELPEPLLDSVTSIRFALGGAEAAVLAELGIPVGPDPRATDFAAVDDSLQARTGIAAGTPISVG